MKRRQGHFFEDFSLGQHFDHPTPRTVSQGDASVYIALTGARHAPSCSLAAARAAGYDGLPLDDMLVFNMAFGKTVSDISLNAVANLGYADLRFHAPVFAGDTLRAHSEVIGLKETSSGTAGIVYVRSRCTHADGALVLEWIRWVMVRKRGTGARAGAAVVPPLPESVERADVERFAGLEVSAARLKDCTRGPDLWGDYAVGETIRHPCGMTVESADHMSATRLYQNNAMVHFDAFAMQSTPIGARLVYGGHVMSLCRALSYDGLENVLRITAVNGGAHVAPTRAGDTLYAYTRVLDRWPLEGNPNLGALRLLLVGVKDTPVARPDEDGWLPPASSEVLRLDYTVLMPR